MSLKEYLEEKASEWVGYQRPAVDWMITEKGNANSRLERTMRDFPEFAKVVRQIPCPLSRQDVFNCYKEDLYKGFVATLLWDRLRHEPFDVYHLFPFLVEPADNVRAKLKKIQNHLQHGDIPLSELFSACESPLQLKIAEKVNYNLFTLALDHLAMAGCNIVHPLMYNPRMRDVHCALLLEDIGTAEPFYDITGRSVFISTHATLANSYEDYCRRLGDLGLWAGCGNPEFLVDWLNYSDEGKLAYAIAKEVIFSFRKKLQEHNASSHNALSLAEFVQQTGHYAGNQDALIANYAANLYTDNEADRKHMLQLLEDNNLVENRGQYKVYSSKNRGCSIENPFSISTPQECPWRSEEAIANYLIFWSSTEETHRELTNITMHNRGSKWIEGLTYCVYRNSTKKMERYYFDLTNTNNQ